MTDKRKQEKNDKIEPLHVTPEMAEDPIMDYVLREGLKREADRIEEELRNRPDLPNLDDRPEEKEEIFNNIVWELKKKGLWDEEDSESEKKDPVESLSEEDRQALELGRKMMHEGNKKWKHRALKGIVSVAIVVLGVFTVSMSTEANRLRLLSVWNNLVNEELRIDIDSKEDRIREKIPEQEAYSEIENRLGIAPIQFLYSPEELIYDNFSIDEQDGRATLFYNYKDIVFAVYMYKQDGDASSNYRFDGKTIKIVKSHADGIEMEIQEIESPEGRSSLATGFLYGNAYYLISGELPEEEFEKVVAEIYF